jgi:hypothetical protein
MVNGEWSIVKRETPTGKCANFGDLNLSGLSALGGRKNISRKDAKDAKETPAFCALREHGAIMHYGLMDYGLRVYRCICLLKVSLFTIHHSLFTIQYLRNYRNSYEIDD